MTIIWHHHPFQNLSASILYQIIKLREEVFIVEQNCPYLDADGLDPKAFHLFATQADEIIAYARIFPCRIIQQDTVIGRVIVRASHRGQNLGYRLMQEVEKQHPSPSFYLGAQAHLERFYGNVGYVRAGPNYDEDGIPHIPMRKQCFFE